MGVKNISTNDNFFRIGGHSLLAMQLVSRIKSQYQLEIEIKVIFEHPTIQDLTKIIAGKKASNKLGVKPLIKIRKLIYA